MPANRAGPDFSASGVRPPMYAHPGCGHGRAYRPGTARPAKDTGGRPVSELGRQALYVAIVVGALAVIVVGTTR
ncbi:hypothetical protein OG373_08180 [Streptomyces avidinii]|uniref:hypothetical protein n=1 Tax=Streptomyces avidinii TaxID=1895 RepID=UPI00386C3E2D|nr:hypothetical protein OG373_08180 [Streptomyces avidinii]